MPRRAASGLAAFLAIRLVEIPLPMRGVDVSMYWHERTHHSGPHRWLRERVRDVLAPASGPKAAETPHTLDQR